MSDEPRIVYWNLRRSEAAGRYPVEMGKRNVVMLSGFSQGLLKSFLAGKLLGARSAPCGPEDGSSEPLGTDEGHHRELVLRRRSAMACSWLLRPSFG